MEMQFSNQLLDTIFEEFKTIDDIERQDLEIIRVLLFDDTARKKGLIKSQIVEELREHNGNVKIYNIQRRLRKLINYNIIGELPNLLDMRSQRYYLVCLQKYRRNEE